MAEHTEEVDVFALIKSKVPIVEYISQFTELKQSGGDNFFRGPCPIHGGNNKTAFSVHVEKAVFRCHNCGAGGSVIDFYQLYEDTDDLQETLTELAKYAGIDLPRPEKRSGKRSLSEITKALTRLAEGLNEYLYEGKDPKLDFVWDYLEDRGLDEDMIDRYLLGYLPEGKAGVDLAIKLSGNEAVLRETEFLGSKDGRTYAMHGGRLIFPIRNERGAVIGFGGRQIKEVHERGPKYLNSPESEVYQKSKVLYGAEDLRRFTGRVYITEGYLDRIAVSQSGLENTIGVATCGVAFTSSHADMLAKATEVIFLFDGDDAGKKAVKRAVNAVNVFGDHAYARILPGDKDPWDLFRDEPEHLRDILSDHPSSLLLASARAAHDTDSSDDFDVWVAETYARLKRSDHRETLIKFAAKLQKQNLAAYTRATLNIKTKKREESGIVAEDIGLNPSFVDLVSRIMVTPKGQLDALPFGKALLDPDRAVDALSSFFPVSGAEEAEILLYAIDQDFETEADVVPAISLIKAAGNSEEVPSISSALRAISASIRAHLAKGGAHSLFPTIEALTLLDRIDQGQGDQIEGQLGFLALLFDLAMNIS